MSEFGKTLRAAREAKGLTTGQIAEQTHMMIQTVEGLENEDFSKIVAPIYGRGFVKLYCEAVGLDPKPLVDTFTEIYADRHAAPPKAAVPLAADPAREEPPAPPTTPEPAPPPKAAVPPPKFPELDFGAQATPSLSRYAGKVPSDGGPSISLPFVNWRIVALVVGAFAALLCLGLVVRAIYHVTMSPPGEPAQEVQSAETPNSPAEPKQATKPNQSAKTEQTAAVQSAVRKPLPLKPFYIDSDHSTETEKEKERKK